MNAITITGRFVEKPETKISENTQRAFCNFTLAVSRNNKGKEVDFIPCVAFEKLADCIGTHMDKGSKVLVQGKLQSNKHKTEDGKTYMNWAVVANNVEFLGYAKKSNEKIDEETGELIK